MALFAMAAAALVSSHAASTRELLRVTWSLVLWVELVGECIGKQALAWLWCVEMARAAGEGGRRERVCVCVRETHKCFGRGQKLLKSAAGRSRIKGRMAGRCSVYARVRGAYEVM